MGRDWRRATYRALIQNYGLKPEEIRRLTMWDLSLYFSESVAESKPYNPVDIEQDQRKIRDRIFADMVEASGIPLDRLGVLNDSILSALYLKASKLPSVDLAKLRARLKEHSCS